jgi:two-component system response regulator NreC
MSIVNRILYLLGLRRDPGPRYYALDEHLDEAITNLATQENLPPDKIVANILSSGLAHYYETDELWGCWQSLSRREQQVTVLTCLGYTNPQMAARLGISTETIKTHLRNALRKFNLGSKSELRKALAHWDFRAFKEYHHWVKRTR